MVLDGGDGVGFGSHSSSPIQQWGQWRNGAFTRGLGVVCGGDIDRCLVGFDGYVGVLFHIVS